MNKRQELQQQADAWMAANSRLIGIPAELPGISVKGRLHHEVNGDGHDNLPWRFQGQMNWSEKTGKWSVRSERPASFNKQRGTRRIATEEGQQYVSRCSQRIKFARQERTPLKISRVGNRSVFDAAFNFGLPCDPPGDWREGTNARRQAEKEMKNGGLRKTTILMGERLPFDLSIQKRKEWSDRTLRNRRVCSFEDLFDASMLDDMDPADMFADSHQIELIELAELRELLRSYVTQKEMEALEQRAAGVAVRDRHCLKRAQRKAVAALQSEEM